MIVAHLRTPASWRRGACHGHCAGRARPDGRGIIEADAAAGRDGGRARRRQPLPPHAARAARTACTA